MCGGGGGGGNRFTRKVLSDLAMYYRSHIRPVNFNSFPAHGCYSCFIKFFFSTWLVIMILMLLRKEIILRDIAGVSTDSILFSFQEFRRIHLKSCSWSVHDKR